MNAVMARQNEAKLILPGKDRSSEMRDEKSQSTGFWIWLAVAIGVALWLRLDQFLDQTLIDDEWHAVHQLIQSTPSKFILSFGHADYSIPLTLWYWLQAQWFGLSELGMRLPMMLAGIATVLLFPLALRKSIDARIVVIFAFLLACSPLLITFSRMARPYALTLLFSFSAYACLLRAVSGQRFRWVAGAGYAVLSALTLWLHPITGPFLVAPLVLLWFRWIRERDFDSVTLLRLTLLTALTGLLMAFVVLPPLLLDPAALAGKSGIHSVKLSTIEGIWFLWFGTGSAIAVVLAIGLSGFGLPLLIQKLQIVRWALTGIALTILVILVMRPAWIYNPLTFARYLLPAVPLLLLAVAAGIFRLLSIRGAQRMTVFVGVALLAAWSFTSPLGVQLRVPNSNTLHSVDLVSFRPAENPISPYIEMLPLSPFWASLSPSPAGSITVAVAPFRFESFDWPAPIWERVSRQRVIPAFVSGTCETWVHGNTPNDARFRFRNAVQVADKSSLARAGVEYIAFFRASRNLMAKPETPYLPHCETWMRNHFGKPSFDDESLVVWRVGAA
jgi:Dolichyl-phosphate-mannose-protein mannosyltransferase